MLSKPFKKRFQTTLTGNEAVSDVKPAETAPIKRSGRSTRLANRQVNVQNRRQINVRQTRQKPQPIEVVKNQPQRACKANLKEQTENIPNPPIRIRYRTTRAALGNTDQKLNRPDSQKNAGRSLTMRVGRRLRKTAVVEPKKTKPCFVRLEKVQEEKPESKGREREKVKTPANRKLTGPLKKRPLNPSPVIKKADEAPTTVASTRSRRAPKPNPKYANADIITPKAKAPRGKGNRVHDEESDNASDSAEDFYNDLDEASNASDANDMGAADVFEVESSDFSENEKPHTRARRSQKVGIQPPSSTPTTGFKRGRPKTRLSPLPTSRTNEQKKVSLSQTPSQRSSTMGGAQQPPQNRKRKIEDVDMDEEPPESIIARNKRLNIALYDANVTKPVLPSKSVTSKVGVNSRTQSPVTTSTNVAQKRLAQSQNPIRSTSSLAREEKTKSPLHKKSSNDKEDSASTQDDFETMPTFTIVNINDIINKKGDCLVQKNAEEAKSPPSTPAGTTRVNRRKSGHTTILSEKIDTNKIRTPIQRTPIPAKKPIILNSSTVPRTEPRQPVRAPITIDRKPVASISAVTAEKPAPRILNSVVAKRTHPIQPILGKLDNDIDLDPSEDSSEKTKENVGANKVIPLKPAQPRKLPPEKVFVQRQGNKLIKKITCFETWYVINIPETQEPVVKNTLDIPLIMLSNSAKKIKLPSSGWSTKVTLYKLSAQMIGKSNIVPYTGDLSDQNIPEADRDKYQPSCVMFRRMTQQKSKTRMPYDRAVIFKMKTFYTNIDGKNVRLIGAPSSISSFEEIEVLLELVDELDLQHEFVEPASTV